MMELVVVEVVFGGEREVFDPLVCLRVVMQQSHHLLQTKQFCEINGN